MNKWIPVSKRRQPPEGEVVEVMAPNGGTCNLKRLGHLWFLPDGSMYVYYTPAYYRSIEKSELNMAIPAFNFRDITTPKPGLIVYGPAWWLCKDEDPTQALFFGTSPQCNTNQRIVEKLLDSSQYQGKNLVPVFVSISFVPNRE